MSVAGGRADIVPKRRNDDPYRTPAFGEGFELLRLCTISIIVADIKTVRLSKTVGLKLILDCSKSIDCSSPNKFAKVIMASTANKRMHSSRQF